MLARRWSNPSQSTARVTPKCRLGVRKRIAIILICAFAPLCLRAQDDPCSAPILAPPVTVPPQFPVCPPSPPDNLADGTKLMLSCAWLDPQRTDHVLEVFRLLISSPPVANVNEKLLAALDAASPTNDDLFRAALGNPNEYGEPRTQGLPDLVDTLSKATTRGKVDAKDDIRYRIKLFSCTKFVIDQLFTTDGGKRKLVQINDAFAQKNNHVAMYKLLKAVWKQNGEAFDADHLEKLRAAFGVSVDDLAKQVGAKITTSK
jgi:hypothetical protein